MLYYKSPYKSADVRAGLSPGSLWYTGSSVCFPSHSCVKLRRMVLLVGGCVSTPSVMGRSQALWIKYNGTVNTQ